MPTKIAINGFGRIGRPTFRRILEHHPNLEVVAINDLTEPKILAHLLKHDSIYGHYQKTVDFSKDSLIVDGKEIKVFAEKNPANLPWRKLGIDIVIESSGVFTDYEGAKQHLTAGARKVIISAPSKDPDKIPSYVLGVNADKLNLDKYDIVDMASCTTNCLAPVAKVLQDHFKIIRGFMTTCHAYTNDQRILDLAHKDLRRARAAALNIVPTSTGAAKAIGKVIPELTGKLDGIALRVPVPTVSIVDLICQVEKKTSVAEVNNVFKEAANRQLKNILKVEEGELVSSDFIGSTFSAIVDAPLTMVQNDFVKVLAWYDNEYGYSCRLAELTDLIASQLKK